MDKWIKNYYGTGKKKARSLAYTGKPIQLFKDSDRDGVPNVFDCKPYNKRRTDVPMPSGGISEMYARKEAIRQAKANQEAWEKYQRELSSSQQPIIITVGSTDTGTSHAKWTFPEPKQEHVKTEVRKTGWTVVKKPASEGGTTAYSPGWTQSYHKALEREAASKTSKKK